MFDILALTNDQHANSKSLMLFVDKTKMTTENSVSLSLLWNQIQEYCTKQENGWIHLKLKVLKG